MSGPGGTPTKRDQRRDARRSQLQQRQTENRRRRQAEIRRQRIQRTAIWGAGLLVLIIVIALVAHAVIGTGGTKGGSSSSSTTITGTGTYTTPANGDVRDSMTCLGLEGTAEHIHMYLAIFVNGQQVQVPPNTGIVNNGTCFYPLHVHSDPGDENIIHEESPNTDTYTLGAFFDVWGQPLSKTQVMGNKADATHQLQFVTFDGNGQKTVYTGNPLNIPFSEHETIYILYNSPSVTPQPFTNFLPGE